MSKFFLLEYYFPTYYLLTKTHTNIGAVEILEETCYVKDFFPLVDEIDYLCEVELRSSMEKYNSVN